MDNEKYVNPDVKEVPAPVEQPAKGLALASFLCGLGSVVLCGGVPAAVVGLALGHAAKKKGNRSGLRKVGTVFSIIGIVFHVLLMVFAATVMPAMLDEIAPGMFGDDSVEIVTNPPAHIPEPETTRPLTVAEMFVYTSNGNGTYAIGVKNGCQLPADVTIPARYRDGIVTEISHGGFCDQKSLRSISIPDTVTALGVGAFASCPQLTEVSFSSESKLTAVWDSAFRNCDSLESFTLPDGVKYFGYECFADCASLLSVEFPDSLVDLGIAAFRGSPHYIPTFPLPEGITSIPNCVYQECSFPTYLLPKTVTSIGSYAFNGGSLDSIVYDGTVEEWHANVTLDPSWIDPSSSGTYHVQVVCTDGTVVYTGEAVSE